jgi:transcriptional regulator with XRE-family HTH domain
MKTLAEEIGERIKALRTEKGMSQGAACEIMWLVWGVACRQL